MDHFSYPILRRKSRSCCGRLRNRPVHGLKLLILVQYCPIITHNYLHESDQPPFRRRSAHSAAAPWVSSTKISPRVGLQRAHRSSMQRSDAVGHLRHAPPDLDQISHDARVRFLSPSVVTFDLISFVCLGEEACGRTATIRFEIQETP